ncbi:hypothetical protein RvY_01928-2 [Ramazzottius varieornatus]|uniref:Uncharacterized protein n=1 Tax=Ramazzottius varieornatus TaxID=947166 RepID=A0A1D1USN2_RAMVA|nr:hypothetical protein RvY_01928-2 [Ramazzottius varieornatus]
MLDWCNPGGPATGQPRGTIYRSIKPLTGFVVPPPRCNDTVSFCVVSETAGKLLLTAEVSLPGIGNWSWRSLNGVKSMRAILSWQIPGRRFIIWCQENQSHFPSPIWRYRLYVLSPICSLALRRKTSTAR